MAIDGRGLALFQIPTVFLHATVMSDLGLPDLTLVTVRLEGGRRSVAAWLVGSDGGRWDTCPTPVDSTARLSAPVWRDLRTGADRPADGDRLEIVIAGTRVPVLPARIERVLSAAEVGLHRDDARRLGLRRWASVNHDGVPALCRVRRTRDDRDRGHVRLSYQARMLLNVPPGTEGARPEVLVGPPPARGRRMLRVGEPRWSDRGTRWPRRLPRRAGTGAELAGRVLLRAPALCFRTIEATPGEDREQTVRLPEELFALLGTEPGKQVYLEWGPGNRTVATALPLGAIGDGDWPQVRVAGHRGSAPRPPDVSVAAVGAVSRAALGVPRTTVVTVRRRVGPLVASRLHQLVVPTTALMVALTADIKLKAWDLALAGAVIVGLMLAPLRMRRNPRGRV
ncbi:hypothetical protein [Actinomadura algeriensis]|uniref:Uncharacterized protein n=1 Tax=Actinomadura algeriensis TaxID=1679523 RepID=A0ABR9K0Q0_9ACTN|nr:hypothetical protein [Actinomadura algeriensis]MBE1536410.1 hypothetical protein [Actinomadura algeriensis]